jgi:3-hydroxymyristoyl/3-hydroxydecanoyl-(acyl carrier protein) dehydratase
MQHLTMLNKEIPLIIAADHPAFAGHFPGMPIVPGVVLLDEVLHALQLDQEAAKQSWQISNVKFLSPMKPGDTAVIRYACNANGSIIFDIVNGERHIVTGSLAMVIDR